jgi:hypothetical protein
MKKMMLLLMLVFSPAFLSAQLDFMIGRSSYDILKDLVSSSPGKIVFMTSDSSVNIMSRYTSPLLDIEDYYIVTNNICIFSVKIYTVKTELSASEKFVDKMANDYKRNYWYDIVEEKKTKKYTIYSCARCNHDPEAKTVMGKIYSRERNCWQFVILSATGPWKIMYKTLLKPW